MKKKIIIFVMICVYSICVYRVNAKYHGHIINQISVNELMSVDDVGFRIVDYSFYKPEEYNLKYSGTEESDVALCYFVLKIELSNDSDKPKYINMTKIKLVQDEWDDYLLLDDFYLINNFNSYNFEILPGHSGEFFVPFLYTN